MNSQTLLSWFWERLRKNWDIQRFYIILFRLRYSKNILIWTLYSLQTPFWHSSAITHCFPLIIGYYDIKFGMRGSIPNFRVWRQMITLTSTWYTNSWHKLTGKFIRDKYIIDMEWFLTISILHNVMMYFLLFLLYFL